MSESFMTKRIHEEAERTLKEGKFRRIGVYAAPESDVNVYMCPTSVEPGFPKEEKDRTVAGVRSDLLRRSEVGIAKYGMTVADNPLTLRQWLQHAYEETLDKAVYLRRAMDEIDALEKAGGNHA